MRKFDRLLQVQGGVLVRGDGDGSAHDREMPCIGGYPQLAVKCSLPESYFPFQGTVDIPL